MSIRLIKRKDFEQLFRKYGIRVVSGGKHHHLEGEVDGAFVSYPIAFKKGGKEILEIYVKHGRKAFLLTEEDGVTDEDFANGIVRPKTETKHKPDKTPKSN